MICKLYTNERKAHKPNSVQAEDAVIAGGALREVR